MESVRGRERKASYTSSLRQGHKQKAAMPRLEEARKRKKEEEVKAEGREGFQEGGRGVGEAK
jgi:hypothetical protein